MDKNLLKLLGWHICRIQTSAGRVRREGTPAATILLAANLVEADAALGSVYPRLRGELNYLRNGITGTDGIIATLDAGITRLQSLAIDILTTALEDDVPVEIVTTATEDVSRLLLCSDESTSVLLVEQLKRYGHLVRRLDRWDLARRYTSRVTIIDMDGIDPCWPCRADRPLPPQLGRIVAIGSDNTFGTRLKAVRLGAEGYFLKPVDAGALAAALDRIGAEAPKEPLRVLIVDDSEIESATIRGVLEEMGMHVETVRDPELALYALEETQPDIVLLDYHLPKATGPELTGILRQHEPFVGLPIVYLAGEKETATLWKTLRGGGEALLSKDAHLEYLVQVCKVKAERYRLLREISLRDGMTGLYNHSTILRHFQDAVRKARDSGESMSYALLDIDRFKRVNDDYGHKMGDTVIQNLSRLIRRKVRKTDIVGRYGGEEFSVLMPGAGEEEAITRLEDIRAAFSGLEHSVLGREESIRVTLSAGIAGYPHYTTADEIGQKADTALYRAKNGGRNRVELYRE